MVVRLRADDLKSLLVELEWLSGHLGPVRIVTVRLELIPAVRKSARRQ